MRTLTYQVCFCLVCAVCVCVCVGGWGCSWRRSRCARPPTRCAFAWCMCVECVCVGGACLRAHGLGPRLPPRGNPALTSPPPHPPRWRRARASTTSARATATTSATRTSARWGGVSCVVFSKVCVCFACVVCCVCTWPRERGERRHATHTHVTTPRHHTHTRPGRGAHVCRAADRHHPHQPYGAPHAQRPRHGVHRELHLPAAVQPRVHARPAGGRLFVDLFCVLWCALVCVCAVCVCFGRGCWA